MAELSPPETARLFLDNIVKHHSLPQSIVSDHDLCFTSRFWKLLMHLLGIKLMMSTAFHPQTNGQTERMNWMLEEIRASTRRPVGQGSYTPNSVGTRPS